MPLFESVEAHDPLWQHLERFRTSIRKGEISIHGNTQASVRKLLPLHLIKKPNHGHDFWSLRLPRTGGRESGKSQQPALTWSQPPCLRGPEPLKSQARLLLAGISPPFLTGTSKRFSPRWRWGCQHPRACFRGCPRRSSANTLPRTSGDSTKRTSKGGAW